AQDPGSRGRELKPLQIMFLGEGDVCGIAPGPQLAGNALAQVVNDHEVKARGGRFRGRLDENAIEHFEKIADADLQPGFLEQLAGYALLERLTKLQRSSRNGPLTAQRLAAAPDEQCAAVLDDDSANADNRPLGVLPGTSGHDCALALR